MSVSFGPYVPDNRIADECPDVDPITLDHPHPPVWRDGTDCYNIHDLTNWLDRSASWPLTRQVVAANDRREIYAHIGKVDTFLPPPALISEEARHQGYPEFILSIEQNDMPRFNQLIVLMQQNHVINSYWVLDVPEGEEGRRNPLIVAILSDRIEMVRQLIAHEALVDILDGLPLNVAVYYRHTAIVNILIGAGANIHSTNDIALIMAVRNVYVDIVQILINAGANAQTSNDAPLRFCMERLRRDNVGVDAIRRAEYADMARMLIAAGANRRNALREPTMEGV